jgi:hypothetical protein
MRQSIYVGMAVAACLLFVAPLAGASNTTAFSDATADAPAEAPDIAGVQVSNDDAGTVAFQISFANRSALDDPEFVAVLVDADGNAQTGCARGTFGAEYALDVLSRKYLFGRCDDGKWSFTRRPASFGGSFAGSTLTLRASRRDLGGTNGFAFRIGAATAGHEDASYDFAPNIGSSPWTYKVVAPPQSVKKPPKRKRPRHAAVRLGR